MVAGTRPWARRYRSMEELVLEPRPSRVVLRRADAFEAAAWKPTAARRFDGRPANDMEPSEAPSPAPETDADPLPLLIAPRWLIAGGGCLAAALLGALAGGFLAY